MIPVHYINQVPVGVVRAVAGQVLVLTLVGIYFNQPWVVLFITIDFAARMLNKSKFSALVQVARHYVVPVFNLSHIPTNLKAKQFAAGIGFMMTIVVLGLYTAQEVLLAQSLLGVLAVFAFLESFFGFCAGCKIYNLLIRLRIIEDPECRECRL